MRAVLAASGLASGPTAAPAARKEPRAARPAPGPRPSALQILQRQLQQASEPAGCPAVALAGVPAAAVVDWEAGAASAGPSSIDGSSSSSSDSSSLYSSTQRLSQQAWALLESSLRPSGGSSSSSSSSSSGGDSWSSDASTSGAAAAGALQQPVSRVDVQQLNEPRQQAGGGGGGPGGQGDRDPDFFANVGDAIRTLREDYPLLLAKDLNYSIYREDLVFKDPNLTFRGLRTYRLVFWGLRLHGRLLLQAAHVQVLRIWQPEEAVIKLRWQIVARTRMGASGTFDGISVYRLDRHGRVYQHEVTDVQLRDPPITNPLLYALNFILSPRPALQPTPCPGSWYSEGEGEGLPDVLAAGGEAAAAAAPAPVLLTSSRD